jgi:hypothetical protein
MGTEILAVAACFERFRRERLRTAHAHKNRYVSTQIIFPLMSLHLLILLNFAVAAYLTGLIWTVQVVHYPSFGLVPKADWVPFHAAHTRRMSYVVMAPMVLELGLAIWLAWAGRAALPSGAGWWSLGLVGLIWAVTFFISVPFHNRLEKGFDYIAIDGLTRTNWIRTLAWTARAALLSGLLV